MGRHIFTIPHGKKMFQVDISVHQQSGWKHVPKQTKEDAVKFLNDRIADLEVYKQDLLNGIERDRLNAILERMKETPMMGKQLEYIGFLSDDMGEMFEPEALYRTKEVDGILHIFKI